MSDPEGTDQRSENLEEIQADIDHTREQLAETASELAAKVDVKERAKDKAKEAGDCVSDVLADTKDSLPTPVVEVGEAIASGISPVASSTARIARANQKSLMIGVTVLVVVLVIRRSRLRSRCEAPS